jgi:hypothetical protein
MPQHTASCVHLKKKIGINLKNNSEPFFHFKLWRPKRTRQRLVPLERTIHYQYLAVCAFQVTEAACPFSFGTIFCALFYVLYFFLRFFSIPLVLLFLVWGMGMGGGEGEEGSKAEILGYI